MSVNNRVSVKIEASKLEFETIIQNKVDEIKYNNMKNIDSLDMKISAITSNKYHLLLTNQTMILCNGHS